MSILSVGIDLGLTGEHRVVALGEGAQVCDRFSFETSPEGLAKLGERIFRDGSKPMIVLEPSGLAWIPVVLYLKAVCPESRVMRVKLGKLAALRRYLRGQAKSDAIDALTLAKMAFIDPEELDEVYLPPARMHGLERLTRQRERLEMSVAARKNRLGAILRGYLPGFREAFQDPWSCRARAAYKGCLNPFAVVRGGQEALGALLAQAGPRARQAGIEARALYQACEGLVALYEQTMGVGMVDEGFFLDLQEEVYRELHLEDHLRTLPGVGEHTAPVFLQRWGTRSASPTRRPSGTGPGWCLLAGSPRIGRARG